MSDTPTNNDSNPPDFDAFMAIARLGRSALLTEIDAHRHTRSRKLVSSLNSAIYSSWNERFIDVDTAVSAIQRVAKYEHLWTLSHESAPAVAGTLGAFVRMDRASKNFDAEVAADLLAEMLAHRPSYAGPQFLLDVDMIVFCTSLNTGDVLASVLDSRAGLRVTLMAGISESIALMRELHPAYYDLYHEEAEYILDFLRALEGS